MLHRYKLEFVTENSKNADLFNTWFLKANLIIAKGATFHIDSTDTKWLKISSKITRD